MHEIIAKIARFAVSKAAAFCYAVAVGVAGNLIFHFVQPESASTPVALAPSHSGAPTSDQGSAGRVPIAPVVPQPAPAPAAQPPAVRASLPTTTTTHPAAPRPAATAPTLPEAPEPAVLPRSDTLSAPALKPAAVPSEDLARPVAEPAHQPSEAALRPAATPADPPPPAPAAALPPLGPAIEVTSPPAPAAIPETTARVTPPLQPEPSAKAPANDIELSDVWHPGRAVEKGLHWAGRQIPLVGSDDATPPAPRKVASPSAPISLLPPAAAAVSPDKGEVTAPAKPAAPGPGSGGLY